MNFWILNPPSDAWGWNPASVEAGATFAAAIFAVVAAVIAGISWHQSRTEISSRMRPWVGLYDFAFLRDENGKPRLLVLLRNVGPLPAQRAHLVVEIKPRFLDRLGEVIVPIRSEKFEDKALMPDEDGHFGIRLDQYRDLETWISAKRDLDVAGVFTYALGNRKFELKFHAELWFSRPKPSRPLRSRLSLKKPTTGLVKTNWRNTFAA